MVFTFMITILFVIILASGFDPDALEGLSDTYDWLDQIEQDVDFPDMEESKDMGANDDGVD